MTIDHTTRLPAVAATPGCVWPDDPSDVRPAHFGSAAAEYVAATDAAALIDIHDRTQIVAVGTDAIDFLNNFCTAPLKSLEPGHGAEAFFPNIKGRVLSHAFLFRDEDRVYLSADAGQNETLLTHLRKYKLGEDVELIDSTGAWGELAVAGPDAAAVLTRLLAADAGGSASLDVGGLAVYEHLSTLFDGEQVVVRRVPLLPVPTYTVAAETATLNALWPVLVGTGATPAGSCVYETLRIEAGWPQMGLDISDANLVQEVARTKQAVSFEKGCYLGQEPIARLDAMGHTNKELRRVRIDGEAPLPSGVVTLEDADVGQVSSSAPVPGKDQTVGLAVVRIKAASVGTTVQVDGRDAVIEWFD